MKAIEFIIVIVILGIVFAMLISAFSGFRSSGYLIDSETHIIGILRDARSRTLASLGNTQYGVHFEETKVVFFVGSTYNSSATTNKIYTLPAGVRISNISLGGASDIVYARLTGVPSASGSITIQLKKDTAQTKTINISATGVIQ